VLSCLSPEVIKSDAVKSGQVTWQVPWSWGNDNAWCWRLLLLWRRFWLNLWRLWRLRLWPLLWWCWLPWRWLWHRRSHHLWWLLRQLLPGKYCRLLLWLWMLHRQLLLLRRRPLMQWRLALCKFLRRWRWRLLRRWWFVSDLRPRSWRRWLLLVCLMWLLRLVLAQGMRQLRLLHVLMHELLRLLRLLHVRVHELPHRRLLHMLLRAWWRVLQWWRRRGRIMS